MISAILKTQHFLFGNFPGKLIGITVGSGILFVSYLFISRTVVYNSDDASIILEAQAMLHGNTILHGWYVPTDNFLTIDIPFYTLGLLLGLSVTSLLHVIPAFLYTLVVVSGGYLASTLLPEKERLWSLLAFLGIAAFPSVEMIQGLLVGPIHIGTIFLILVGLIAYRYQLCLTGKKSLAALVGVLLVIVLTIVGDPFALVVFVLPLILTEVWQMLMKKRLALRENSMLLGILCAVILAFGIRELLELAGEHNVLLAGFLFTSLSGMANNFVSALRCLSIIFHANIFTPSAYTPSNVSLFINLLLLVVLLYAIIRWCIRFLFRSTNESSKVTSVLLWGSIGIFTAFTVSTLGGMSEIRYLYPIFVFIGIVSFLIMHPFVNKYVLRCAIIVVLLANIASFAVSLYQAPSATTPEAHLLTFLEGHHFTQGLGTYWVSPIVTIESKERIVIRQVVINHHQIHPEYFLVDNKWFARANLQRANFIVYMQSDAPQDYYGASVQSFGMPDHQYTVGVYTVLAWDAPLLMHMQPQCSFWTP